MNLREPAARLADAPIAIVGMACRLPGGVEDLEGFWCLLREGKDAIIEVPPDRWDVAAADRVGVPRSGGFIPDIEAFDREALGLSPKRARSMDPQQRLLLEVTWQALEDAGLPRATLAGTNTGVFVGGARLDFASRQLTSPEAWDAFLVPGAGLSYLANRVSQYFDLRGPSLTVDASCASSLTALHLGVQALRCKQVDAAIIAGVNFIGSPAVMASLMSGGLLAADGRCRTLDAHASGFGCGEGCGVLVLKRLDDALADRDAVHALVRGSAVGHAGRTGLSDQRQVEAEAAVIAAALRDAGTSADAVDYVELHGTATPLGDATEVAALQSIFGDRARHGQALIVGCAKTNLGHLEAASGVAGVIKVALALQRGLIPAHLHFQEINVLIARPLAFIVPIRPMPWPETGRPAVAGVSSFGIGGTNAHVLMQAAPPRQRVRSSHGRSRVHVLPVSTPHPRSLPAFVRAFRDTLRAAGPDATDELEDIVYTAGARRSHERQRMAVVGTSRRALADGLDRWLQGDVAADEPSPVVDDTEAELAQALSLHRRYLAGSAVASDWRARYPEALCTRLPVHPFVHQTTGCGP